MSSAAGPFVHLSQSCNSAARCNAMQHVATQCTVLQISATCCKAVQHVTPQRVQAFIDQILASTSECPVQVSPVGPRAPPLNAALLPLSTPQCRRAHRRTSYWRPSAHAVLAPMGGAIRRLLCAPKACPTLSCSSRVASLLKKQHTVLHVAVLSRRSSESFAKSCTGSRGASSPTRSS